MTFERFDAVLFDLDGVLTATASAHAAAWKAMFDEFLVRRAESRSESARLFDVKVDYPRYVDGRPRLDGVRTFLASRGIEIPEGAPADPPSAETVCGLGNRKNALVQAMIASQGVETYAGALALLRQVRASGLRTAVVSSSRNCPAVIRAAGIGHLIDVQVDGNVTAELALPGKPAPDAFLAAAERLGVEARRAVVVEDAMAGVDAGRAGGFGLVIAVDHVGQREAFLAHGADLVVDDLGELVEPGGAGARSGTDR